MSETQAAILESHAAISVSGAEARHLLQGLVTSDVDDMEPGTARNSALLTPQGKILFEFILYADTPDRFLLDTLREPAPELVKRLTFYRLRAKVEITEMPDHIVALWGDESPQAGPRRFADPRLPALGRRAILPSSELEATLSDCMRVSESAYQTHRIALGVAELGPDYGSGEIFPHEADLDQLGGVDFAKGCFIGQEVVSRMHHRGTARSRFVPVEIDGPAPEAGTGIEAGGRTIGKMGSSAGNRGLALLRLDRVGDAIAAGHPIRAGEATLQPVRPDWARFDWPGGDEGPGETGATES